MSPGWFDGVGQVYDQNRPRPPAIIADLLTQVAGVPRPTLVVDLGCGTGLSTLLWAGQADAVVGVEPEPDMRRMAIEAQRALPAAANVRFVAGDSAHTGLPSGDADIITCAQSFHWMDAESTLAEVARLLRPGGVFAVYDYAQPPIVDWQAEAVYLQFRAEIEARCEALGMHQRRSDKREHLARIKASGHFRHVREVGACSEDEGDAARFIGIVCSFSRIGALHKRGLTDAEIGLDTFRTAVERRLGSGRRPWYWSYTIRLAVK